MHLLTDNAFDRVGRMKAFGVHMALGVALGTLLPARTNAAAAAPDAPPPGPPARGFAQLELHASLLASAGERSLIGTSFGYGVRTGARWGRFGLFVLAEHTVWVASDDGDGAVELGALDLGLGAEVRYAGDFVRTSVAAGPSLLLYNTPLDDRGSVGLFVELRPTGLRWPVSPWLVLQLDPLAMSVVAPVLKGIPLVMVEYRSVLTTEVRW